MGRPPYQVGVMLQDQISSHSHSEERSMLRLGLASDGATLSLTRLADFHRRSFSRSLSTPALAKKSDEDASDVVIEAGAVERDGDGSRLTLAAQPATNRLMEALVGSRMPSEPLYDLPSWLEHSYPQFDASPKTNLFSWQVWSRHHLTKEKQRSLLAFHQYMSHDHFRRVIIRRSNLELARLWDWQQQRADLGLSPDLTPEEVSKIKTKILQNSPTETSSPLPSPLEALAESSPSSPVAPASSPDSPPRGGILGIIHSKDKDSKKKVVESKSKGLATSHLSPAQRSVVDMMRNPKVEVQELAAAFLSRRKRGEDFMDMVSRFPAGQRVKEILSQELERRRAVDVLGRDDGSSSGLEVKSQLYQSPKERVSGGRKVEVEEAEEGKISLSPLNPLELKREVTGSKSWMETKILDRNVSV